MQVKKFEARSMKEALEMVKTQLGPDAIILSARDNNKSFGLVGEGSVEITAAVSEETLKRKKFVESRLREQEREKLQKSSARSQKDFMNKMVNNYTEEKKQRPPITTTRYIDIDDEQAMEMNGGFDPGERIRNAAQRAFSALQDSTPEPVMHSRSPAQAGGGTYSNQAAGLRGAATAIASMVSRGNTATITETAQVRPVATARPDTSEIQALKNEILGLKNVISQFQHVPQQMAAQHPGAEYGLNYEVSHVFEKLVDAGISAEIAADMLLLAQQQMPALKLKNKALVEAWIARAILKTTNIVGEKTASKMEFFVGPAGSGKTSTLVKLASHYVVQDKKKIALVTTDTYKVGAADQLKIYAQILNVPFAVVRGPEDWARLMPQVQGFDKVLIDSPGFSLKTMEEISAVKSLAPQGTSLTTHLVLSSMAKDSDLTEIGKRFKVTGFNDVIFTALDESIQQGNIYNFMKRFEVPLHSFGIGSRVPEDFEVATKERVLDLIFKLTKMKKEQG